jgi:hypothetical protein
VSRRTVRSSILAGALVGLGVLASGCGGSPGSSVAQLNTTTTQSSPASGGSTRGPLAYASCMHAHGVPLWPDPGSSGSSAQAPLTLHQLDVTSSQLAAAQQACRSLLPAHAPTRSSPHALAQALRFSRCMRAHGATDFPDPESDGALVIPHAMENAPTYLAALHVCLRTYGAPPPPSSAPKR